MITTYYLRWHIAVWKSFYCWPGTVEVMLCHRIREWLSLEDTTGGPLDQAPAPEGSLTPQAGCPEPCSHGLGTPPRIQTPQPLWVAFAIDQHPHSSLKFRENLLSHCTLCLLFCHLALLERPSTPLHCLLRYLYTLIRSLMTLSNDRNHSFPGV